MKNDQFLADIKGTRSLLLLFLKEHTSLYKKFSYLQDIEQKDRISVDWDEGTCLKF
jgi:hypothetical protein